MSTQYINEIIKLYKGAKKASFNNLIHLWVTLSYVIKNPLIDHIVVNVLKNIESENLFKKFLMKRKFK